MNLEDPDMFDRYVCVSSFKSLGLASESFQSVPISKELKHVCKQYLLEVVFTHIVKEIGFCIKPLIKLMIKI